MLLLTTTTRTYDPIAFFLDIYFFHSAFYYIYNGWVGGCLEESLDFMKSTC